jgi:hypothetical protein
MEPEWGPFRVPPYVITTAGGRRYQVDDAGVVERLPDEPVRPAGIVTATDAVAYMWTERGALPTGITYGRPRPEPAVCTIPGCCAPLPGQLQTNAATALENSTWVLRTLLTDAEWQHFLSHREVETAGPSGARYRLAANRLTGNLRYLPPGADPHVYVHWVAGCVHVDPTGRNWSGITGEENLAAQVLMIKTDEEAFLRRTVLALAAYDVGLANADNLRW